MILEAFSLYDLKAGVYATPFFCVSKGVAIRMVIDLAAEPQTTVARHPADFALFAIGLYDDATGTMNAQPPVNLGLVQTFLAAVIQPPGVIPNAERNGS